MAFLSDLFKKNNGSSGLAPYAPGRTYDPSKTILGGSWEQLYNNKAYLTDKNTGLKTEVDFDPSMVNLTAEQQLAIKNNKNMKETQKRLQTAGVTTQQTVMGGGGY